MNKTENKTLYLFKLIASFFVVCIHIPYSSQLGQMISIIGRFAVPMFFMISGYFSYYNDKDDCNNAINKRIKKVFSITAYAFVFYIVYNLVCSMTNNEVRNYISNIFSIKNLINLIAFNYPAWYGCGHLWYLFAIIYVYVIYKCLNRFKLIKIGYIYSFISLLVVYALLILIKIHDDKISLMYLGNAYFIGVPFFMIGHLIRSKEYSIKKFFENKNYIFVILFFLVGMIFCTELYIINMTIDYYISSTLFSAFLLIFAICNPNVSVFSKIGKEYSPYIYIVHFAITDYINNNWPKIGFEKYLYPLIAFLFSLLVSIIYKKYIYTNLKKLFDKNKKVVK